VQVDPLTCSFHPALVAVPSTYKCYVLPAQAHRPRPKALILPIIARSIWSIINKAFFPFSFFPFPFSVAGLGSGDNFETGGGGTGYWIPLIPRFCFSCSYRRTASWLLPPWHSLLSPVVVHYPLPTAIHTPLYTNQSNRSHAVRDPKLRKLK
jgi:hypothetical protein